MMNIISLTCCSNPNSIVDKNKLLPKNYKLFQGSKAWPLAKAIMQNDYDDIDSILRGDPSLVNVKDSVYGNTILMLSIFHQDYNLFKRLQKYNPNVNYYNNWQGSPIYEASRYGNSEVQFIADLLKMGANIDDPIYNDDYSLIMTNPLVDAAGHSNSKVVEFLIKKGANVDFKTDFGRTPLGSALMSDNYDNALLLLNNGADFTNPILNTVDKQGNMTVPNNISEVLRRNLPSPFTNQFSKKKKIVQFLKEHGIDYYSEPIPAHILKRIKSRYGIFWKIYATYY